MNSRLIKIQNISVLLIILTVICPIKCFGSGCCGLENVETESLTSCCPGCHEDEAPIGTPSDSQSDLPADDCPCFDCFCNGAIATTDVSDNFQVDHVVDQLLSWTNLVSTEPASMSLLDLQSSLFFENDSSHLNARASLNTWLL